MAAFRPLRCPPDSPKEVYDRAVVRGSDGAKTAGDLVGPKAVELPVSIDFLGRPFSEPVLIRIAAAYEPGDAASPAAQGVFGIAWSTSPNWRNAMKKILLAACALTPLIAASAAQARITEIKIDAVEPFADNHAFGQAGAYVRIKGVAKGELDPKAPENAAIVDLDKAPRNARGMVEYETDIFIMRPADPAKGNGILYYEVLNRGSKQLGRRLHDTRGGPANNDPKTLADAGNGFLFERGFTVVWSGWEDLGRRENIMSVRLPAVLEDGKPLVRRIREELQVGKRGPADVEVKRLDLSRRLD